MTDTLAISAAPSRRMIYGSLLRADWIIFLKNRRSLILSLLLPYLILQSTSSSASTAKLGGALFVTGLAITYGIASVSIMGYSLSVARDRERGVFQRLRVTPASTASIMVCRLAVQMLANLVIALVVLILAGRIHHLSLSFSQYLLVLLISLLGGAMFLSIGQAIVALVKTSDTVNSAARLVYIALIFLGILGQTGALGKTWDTLARWSPVGVTLRLYAGVLDLSAWSGKDFESLCVAFVYVVVFTFVGVRFFQWESR
ncbi:MAG: ABC transporter permease [Acidimicrobiales bacterium]